MHTQHCACFHTAKGLQPLCTRTRVYTRTQCFVILNTHRGPGEWGANGKCMVRGAAIFAGCRQALVHVPSLCCVCTTQSVSQGRSVVPPGDSVAPAGYSGWCCHNSVCVTQCQHLLHLVQAQCSDVASSSTAQLPCTVVFTCAALLYQPAYCSPVPWFIGCLLLGLGVVLGGVLCVWCRSTLW